MVVLLWQWIVFIGVVSGDGAMVRWTAWHAWCYIAVVVRVRPELRASSAIVMPRQVGDLALFHAAPALSRLLLRGISTSTISIIGSGSVAS